MTGASHLYIHVPFCSRRCSYCDFAIAVRGVVPVDEYVVALRKEIEARRLESGMDSLSTVYLGGGTPSRLGGEGVRRVLDLIRNTAVILPDAEVTLEANPEDIDDEAVAAWMRAGINRLSIGIQSFDDDALKWMHRVHDADTALAAVAAAREGGLPAFSIDLIFSLPDFLKRDWTADLATALSLGPDHISLYGLTVEPETPLGRWVARGEVKEAGEERYEAQFVEAHHTLAAAGYEHYEVSNFARPGKRAVHNSAYWRHVPYLGIGPSAHGFDGSVRRWNLRHYTGWLRAVSAGSDPVAGSETLSESNFDAERVYLGLRTTDGLELTSDREKSRAAEWQSRGWVEVIEGAHDGALPRVHCTPAGWLRLDALAADLTATRSRS